MRWMCCGKRWGDVGRLFGGIAYCVRLYTVVYFIKRHGGATLMVTKGTKNVRVYPDDMPRLEMMRRVYTTKDGIARTLADVIHAMLSETELQHLEEIERLREGRK